MENTMLDLIKDKKGQINIGTKLTTIVVLIITVIVLFQVFASLVPEAQSAGAELSDSTRCGDAGGFFNSSQSLCLNGTNPADTAQVGFDAIPISSIFSSSGVIILLLMVSLFIGVMSLVLPKSRK